MTTADKVKASVRLLQAFAKLADDNGSRVELCFSGGKDSCVIKRLADMAGIKYDAIYKNTTIDPAGTVAFCRRMGCTVFNPRRTFFEVMKTCGWPSRWRRFCCKEMKEYKVPGHDYQIVGIRADESAARAKRYTEPEKCRVYAKGEKARQLMPILAWTLDDVAQFVAAEGVELHPLYLRDDGTPDLTRRLGCTGCPMASDGGRADFKTNPRMLRAWARAYRTWFLTHPNTKTAHRFRDFHEAILFKLFFTKKPDRFEAHQHGLFEPIDSKAFLEDYFGISLDF